MSTQLWRAGTTPCKECGEGLRVKNSSYCRPCKNERWRQWYENKKISDPTFLERRQVDRDPVVYRNYRYLAAYGMTNDQVLSMFEDQDHACLICLKEFDTPFDRNMAVDHNHATGQVRGLLCLNCNSMIGMAGENVLVLQAAIDYLLRGQT